VDTNGNQQPFLVTLESQKNCAVSQKRSFLVLCVDNITVATTKLVVVTFVTEFGNRNNPAHTASKISDSSDLACSGKGPAQLVSPTEQSFWELNCYIFGYYLNSSCSQATAIFLGGEIPLR